MKDGDRNGLVSVIIPVYNVEGYLDRCLDSVVRQSYENLEIICVNDGSTDRSPDICREWMDRDSRIRVIDKENQGLGPARNDGIRAARGEYLLFVDSDDWIVDTCVEVLYQKAMECGADVVIFDYYLTTYDERLKEYHHQSGRRFFDLKGSFVSLREYPAMLARAGGVVWNKFQKTEFVRRHGFSQPAHPYEDIGYVYRLLASAHRIAQVRRELYYYWINRKESITNQSPHLEASKMALLEMKEALEDSGNYREYYPFLEKYAACYLQISLKRLKPGDTRSLEDGREYYYAMYPMARRIDSARFLLIGGVHLNHIMNRVRNLNQEPMPQYSYQEFIDGETADEEVCQYALLDLESLTRFQTKTEEALNVLGEVLKRLLDRNGLRRIFIIETKTALGAGLYEPENSGTDHRNCDGINQKIHEVYQRLEGFQGPVTLIHGPEDEKLFSDQSFQQPLNNYWYYDVADRIRAHILREEREL